MVGMIGKELGSYRILEQIGVGGIDDGSSNESTWRGCQDAAEQLGIEANFLESQSQDDYEVNIAEFAEQGYDMIITVGFAMGDVTVEMAKRYPDVRFAVVHVPNEKGLSNLQGILFDVDEAALLAGNVEEWVADWHDMDYYGRSPSQNPQGPYRTDYKVLRGGSWYSSGFSLRSAYRGFLPTFSHSSDGFRCAR